MCECVRERVCECVRDCVSAYIPVLVCLYRYDGTCVSCKVLHVSCSRKKSKSKANVTKELYTVPGNEVCADCGNSKPKWAR